jgi:hypothetical protein
MLAELEKHTLVYHLLYVTPETLINSTRLINLLDRLHGRGLLDRCVQTTDAAIARRAVLW